MTSKVYAGIDCGYRTGGVALIDKSGFAEVHDLPTYSEGGVDITALHEILMSVDLDHIFVEKQQAMPKQGVSSTFKLGYAYGQIVTTVALTKTPYTILTPAGWKKGLRLPSDKDAARRLAQQWYPKVADKFTRKKDEHRAEALLIAHYGAMLDG
jgi:crossover junction endodeoxyribonuclease RuvC